MGSFGQKAPRSLGSCSLTGRSTGNPMNHTLSHFLYFPIHGTSKSCHFTCPHRPQTTRTYAVARRRRHHRRRLLKQHDGADDSYCPQSDQSLHLILSVEKFSSSQPATLLSEAVDSSRLKLNQVIHAGEEAFEDLRTLVTVDSSTRRVVFSCRKSTVQFLGLAFAACLVVSVSCRVLVSLLMYGRDRFSDMGGQVVYKRDRSLGGREVAVGKMSKSTVQRGEKSRNDDVFMLMLENGDDIRKPFWQRRKRGSVKKLPLWWPTSNLNVDLGMAAADKEEYRTSANRLIRAIMDKRMGGEDVSTDDIIQLRRICKISGVRVIIDTDNIRDSFYRASVDFVLKYCESMGNESTFFNIDGEDARHFVAGLAENIVLESSRAARMVSAAVAARTRSCFLQAWALQIQGNHSQAVAELSKICFIHRIYPPDENSAEMEMVARGLKKQLNLEQRQLLMNLVTKACGEEAHRSLTEALGLIEPGGDFEQPESSLTEAQEDTVQ